ncbi:MAG: prepilin-type N-terminal cleavage/methylation domain-containing protein [Deltaproteobacteria bacterium]|nr:prepilin-type N-terminal cleavage/methylation domain-containing protein [Deltaproteobacteria bacterium]
MNSACAGRSRNNRGVTLIELLIVLIIIAILSVVIFISMSGSTDDARTAAAEERASKFASTIANDWLAKTAGQLVDSTGNVFGPCEVPVTSGAILDAIDWKPGVCFQITVTMIDGRCVDPLAVKGGPVLTSTPCSFHADCPDSWMGCGSFTGYTLRTEPDLSCPIPLRLLSLGYPLDKWDTTCVRTCPPFAVRCGAVEPVP